MKNISILGSTGTIGENTLQVVASFPGKFKVFALTANRNIHKMQRQVLEWKPRYAVLSCVDSAKILSDNLREHSDITTEVLGGPESLEFVAAHEETDYVMAAIVGGAGLLSTMSAARHGKRILLANKESLVMSGELFMNEVKNSGAQLLPIDSEHNAIFQCLPFDYASSISSSRASIKRLILTASGGPFLNTPIEKFSEISVEQACNHPNWIMGQKISIDSATMMNKGLEIIEACHLYDMPLDKVEIVVHPQSIIHSMVEYIDGSVMAQLGTPDMKIPIAYGLGWPERIFSGADFLDFYQLRSLSFEKPDYDKFKCLTYAKEAFKQGGVYPAILNAANEVAVQSFIENKVKFSNIPEIIEHALDSCTYEYDLTIDSILRADFECRKSLRKQIGIKKWPI
ncbi:MAG: 1-deoxy-D-xylulose-5-phosphate reductoisomerase [Methylococcaceae bacterium TMED69]|nr:MAG: 1-deoxy-D-xylulose-5-phosphate reductoisomerase [Methylococcaceae bacterium TMED69]|tara:strand:+ start:272 stop:1468 length:1197 start_codon:yes stop_codon:yes gene_type:complete